MKDTAYSPLKIIHHKERLDQIRQGIQPNPVHVQLIISDLCNQDCSFCAYRMSGYASNQKFSSDVKLAQIGTNNPIRQIEYEKVVEILDDCEKMGVGAIQLTGGGEPSVHPRFRDIMVDVRARGMKLALVTNGVLMSKSAMEILMEASWVRISIDAGNPDSYSKIRRISKDMYWKVWDNIKNLVAMRKDQNSDLKIGAGFVVTKENWREIIQFTKKAKSAGVNNVRFSAVFQPDEDAYFIDFFDDAAQYCRDAELFEDDGFQVFNNFGERVADLRQHAPDYEFCGYQNFTTYIGGDLNVYRCCGYAYNDHGLIGSLENQSFSTLWKSDAKRHNFDTFDATTCERCQFNAKNRTILYALDDQPRDVDFV